MTHDGVLGAESNWTEGPSRARRKGMRGFQVPVPDDGCVRLRSGSANSAKRVAERPSFQETTESGQQQKFVRGSKCGRCCAAALLCSP